MTDAPPESADGSNESVPLAPRISLPSSLTANLSYVDLFDEFVKENDLQVDEDSNSQMAHHYPVIMQSMITRLEKYGRLANMRELTRHSKNAPKVKKTKVEGQDSGSEDSDPNDRYYDLDDGFLAPEDDLERENEGEFDEAVKEGHFILRPEQFVPSASRPQPARARKSTPKQPSANNPGRKKKAKAMTAYPDEIRKQLFALKDLYEKGKKENTSVAFPKGSSKIINDVMSLMVTDPVRGMQSIERTDLCLTLSEITEQPLGRIESFANKQLLSNDKAKLASDYSASCKKLKGLITAECKAQQPTWTQDLKDAYAKCVQSLQASVRKSNEFNAIYHKKKPVVVLEEEEKKLEKEVAEHSSGRLLCENGEFRTVDKPPGATSLQALLTSPLKPLTPLPAAFPTPPHPVLSTELLTSKPLPKRSSVFDAIPPYNPQHFQAKKETLMDLIDS